MSTDQLTRLNQRYGTVRRTLDQLTGHVRGLAETGKRLQAQIAQHTTDADTYTEAAVLLTTIGEQRQADAQTHIEQLVTRGLQTIFGEDLTFHLTPGVRNKTPVVDFVVRSTLDDGTIVDTDVLDARGGGLAATVGFLLRLVVLLLSRDKQQTVLFLDETFAHLSAEYEPRLAEFLRELADRTGVQIIMVTHSDAYTDLADKRYRFDLNGGTTIAREA